MLATLLTVGLLVGSQAPALKECNAVPTPLRVRLTIASGEWRASEPTIRRLVEETWTPVGLQVQWVADGTGWDAIDFWIAIVYGMPTTDQGGALGIVRFKGDEPGPMARVSIDAALIWARRHQARLLHAPINAITAAKAEQPDVVSRLMGYSAAHELGHFVLAVKAHASTGIMRAQYRDGFQLFDPHAWRLDDRNRARLRQRMTETCDRRAAR